MSKRKKIFRILGGCSVLGAVLMGAGTINHILNSGEGIVSSLLLTFSFVCFAVFCFLVK